MREPGEDYLSEATIRLLDETEAEVLQYRTDGQSAPHCLRDLQRNVQGIEAVAPDGFGLTSAAGLRLDLRQGGEVEVEFGAVPGLEVEAGPLMQPATPEEAPANMDKPSVLRELSGLFVLILAGIVLSSGMLVAIFLRGR